MFFLVRFADLAEVNPLTPLKEKKSNAGDLIGNEKF